MSRSISWCRGAARVVAVHLVSGAGQRFSTWKHDTGGRPGPRSVGCGELLEVTVRLGEHAFHDGPGQGRVEPTEPRQLECERPRESAPIGIQGFDDVVLCRATVGRWSHRGHEERLATAFLPDEVLLVDP